MLYWREIYTVQYTHHSMGNCKVLEVSCSFILLQSRNTWETSVTNCFPSSLCATVVAVITGQVPSFITSSFVKCPTQGRTFLKIYHSESYFFSEIKETQFLICILCIIWSLRYFLTWAILWLNIGNMPFA